MKLKKTIIGVTFLVMAATPLTSAFAMQGMSGMNGMASQDNSNKMEGMQMSMTSSGTDIMLKSDTREGVKGMAHLKDIKEAMAANGGTQTHHLMVKFAAEEGGQSFDNGVAAVKIIDPDGKQLSPLKMMGMSGSFGADMELTKPGNYVFEVGTKLNDGKKRVFRFQYNNESNA